MKAHWLCARICLLGLSLIVEDRSFGQPFVNLGFEQAHPTLVPGSSFFVYASSALPSWTPLIDGQPQAEIVYNTVSLGAPCVSIQQTNSYVLSGRFSVVLQSGYIPFNPPVSAGISQTGDVPLGTRSLQFLGDNDLRYDNLTISLGGTIVPIHALEEKLQGTIYGADITGWAGRTTELRFTASPTYIDWFTFVSLDQIQFSPQAIPEPSVAGFVASALLCLGFGARGQRTGCFS